MPLGQESSFSRAGRPQFHFTVANGWMNDPHGITYRDGEYHVFFQYVPGRTDWAPNCHWGHAVGKDLLSLREAEVAISPGDGDGGIWTGSLVTDTDGEARIFYTSTNPEDFNIGRIRMATTKDPEWRNWVKGAVVVEAPAGLDIATFRDPFVRLEADGWRMFVGAGLHDGTAAALAYTSSDLEVWDFDGVVLQRSRSETDMVWTGALWECPQFFQLGGKSVMVSSIWDDDVLYYAAYAVGTFVDGSFQADTWGRLTFGDSYYAPSLFTDADGEPGLVFWMRGAGGEEQGWAGAHSVPYSLELVGDRLVARPHRDVEAHRGPRFDGQNVAKAMDITWSGGEGGQLVISSGGVAVQFRWEPGEVIVSQNAQEASSDRLPVLGGPVRILLDGPLVEVSEAGGLLGVVTALGETDARVSVTTGALEGYVIE